MFSLLFVSLFVGLWLLFGGLALVFLPRFRVVVRHAGGLVIVRFMSPSADFVWASLAFSFRPRLFFDASVMAWGFGFLLSRSLFRVFLSSPRAAWVAFSIGS